jgi:hypothetical protein
VSRSQDTYTYEPGGGTEFRMPSGGAKRSFLWDSEGNLASVTQGSAVTQYQYEPETGRFLSADAAVDPADP